MGRILVSVGVLLFAFVAYQLWGTGIQTAREQDRLRAEFDELLEAPVPTSSPVTITTAMPIEPTSTDLPEASIATSLDPIVTVPPTVASTPRAGDPVASLEIEAMGVQDQIVIEGISPGDLQDGPGHFPETPLPGQLGNAAVAGHRTTHGQPFRHIDRLQPGDDIIVTTLAGTYVYTVTGQTIVDPSDYAAVIPTVDPTKATLTLTSCDPPFSAERRMVVFSELDVERSSPVSPPSAVVPETSAPTIPEEDPSEPTSTSPGTSIAVASTEPVATEPAGTVPSNSVNDSPDGEELFQNRWFSDPDAFPQVALWGAVLTALAVAAFRLSRRAGSNWVGALVGFVPFVWSLYYFFENVNRLLPPNL